MTRKQKQKETNISNENVDPPMGNALPVLDHPSLTHKYWCGCCNFSAKTPSGFRNHLYSNRHYRNWTKDVSIDGVSASSRDNISMLFNERVSVSSPIDASVRSNDIINLLDEIDERSDCGSGREPELELVLTELDDIGSDVDAPSYYDESESESDGEYASDDEYDSNVESDEDIDLPLYGTGLFYPEDSHNVRIRPLKEELPGDVPDPLFMATAFVLGMVAERCFSQFVRNLCAC